VGSSGRLGVLYRPLLAVMGLVLVLTAGCSTGNDPVPGPSTTQPPVPSAAPTSTPSPAALAGEQALVAYRGMWVDFVAAGTTSDWQSPNLGHHATGVALTNLSRGLYADRVNGLVTRGEPELSPTVSSAEPASDPTRVVVTDPKIESGDGQAEPPAWRGEVAGSGTG
jgi:hypothetical protein